MLICGCGNEGKKITYDIIIPDERIFTFEDLEEIGFKKNRQYDVSKLEGAKEAWNGFWSPDKKQKEYELRFYPSHSVAVALGESFAQEVTGKDAKLKKSEVTWEEGIKDRRQIIGREGGSRNSVGPKHGNYAIFANIVMLCEGPEDLSLEVCWKLITVLKSKE